MKKVSTQNNRGKYLRGTKATLLSLFFFLFAFQSQNSSAQCLSQFTFFSDSLNPSQVTFLNASSTSAGTITSWQWNFGDGSTSPASDTTHFYSAPGIYNVCLTIVTDLGCTDTSCMVVTVPGSGPTISIDNFGADSSGTLFCSAPAAVDFWLSGMTNFTPFDSALVYVNYGDGTDTTFYTFIQQTYYYSFWQHVYVNSGTYNPTAIVSWNGVSDTMMSDPIIVNSNCGPLVGTVYLDNNSDCIFNTGDETLPNITVSLAVGGTTVMWTQTDSMGVYSFNVPSGSSYDVTVHISNWYGGTYTVNCPSSGTITVPSIPSSGNDFFLSCPSGFDLTGTVVLSGVVPGRTGNVCVFAYDQFCNTPNGQIKVILDPMLTAIPDSSSNYTISGDTIIWNYTNATSYWSHCAQVTTNVTATIGDTACITMIIEPISGDSDPGNNVVTTCTAVRTSYDPNDKAGEPYGQGLNNAILPGTEITYTIRFQNTGTAEAYDIYILDTLDASFDLNSLEILGASHAMVPSILADNVVRFSFANIMLPDSNANEPLSHGYVQYRITPAAGIPDGTELLNTAGIYFDFNPPVITNTTLHTIDYTLSVKKISIQDGIQLSPNPSNEKVIVNMLNKGNYKLNLINMLGETVYTASNVVDRHTINTSHLPTGVYLVRSENAHQIFQSRLVISH
ncbi:MAG TPA: PKD domain-containing protein [Bacteroidia bacterium]|nr:PKD domain-containing protein [Bacteroidia bacterium]HNS13353.1 PKD domain-containing protein [Bacteroidia bacterium]